jgi:hypothetical protein
MSTRREREQERRRQRDDQRRAQAESTQQSAAVQSAIRDESTAKNPEFLEQFAGIELDGRVYNWLEDEIGPEIAQVHALGNRSEDYAFEQRLLNRNTAERIIAEWTPGRQLREHPKLNYLAQGCRGLPEGASPEQDPEYRAPLTEQERRILRSTFEAVTAHQSRSQEHMGADAVSKVQTESRTVQDDRSEESTASKVRSKVFG